MPLPSDRWSAITDSEFPWEREAFAFLKERLPDADPWHVWSNFEFIDDQGLINEVDALVLGPRGLFLVEIKSHPGRIEGDAHSWTWTPPDGRRRTFDNPYILCNRKTKRLRSLLQRQESMTRARLKMPFVTPLVFLSAEGMDLALPEALRTHVFPRGAGGVPGIIQALTAEAGPAARHGSMIEPRLANALGRAMAEAGVRPSLKARRVGDYDLLEMLDEGEGFQDFAARHVAAGIERRVRIYGVAAASGDDARQALQNMALREFRILEGISHPGILKVNDYKESDRGPALVFDYDPKAVRLDFILGRPDVMERLDVHQRLHMVRQLAETLKYAHDKRLFHRALSPRSILVRNIDQAMPTLQIMNWQTAARDAATSQGSRQGAGQQTVGTAHLDDFIDDPTRVYMAPEAMQSSTGGPHEDIFSLGAIAYHLFTGQPPASNAVELMTRLRGEGLLLSAVIDGASQHLQKLIARATHPMVSMRLEAMVDVLDCLTQAEQQLVPEDTGLADPSGARPGDRLDGGFTVVQRLGRGGSADALLVRRDGDEDQELVLKVAIDATHNHRLAAEAETLRAITHQNIVRMKDAVSVSGRTAVLMERAGASTLGEDLRSGHLPSLDLARRYGEDLLSAVDFLAEHAIAHRDIKPDNIGIRKTGSGGRYHLVLFDFSLSKTSPDNIQAGTRPYLDPFLSLRRPARWDAQAELFAVAVTLYEMITGSVPTWGDGRSDPALVEGEAILETERFDPHLRDGLTSFFTRALRRNAAQRFDNAEDMLRDWRRVFDAAQPAPLEAGGIVALARRLTPQTPVAELGYSVEALSVLERMGVQTVRQLLGVPRAKFRYMKSVADRIRKEIRLIAKDVARERPDLVPGGTSMGGDDAPGGQATLDDLYDSLLARRPAGADDTPEDAALAVLLGMEEDGPPSFPHPWPRSGDVATRLDIGRLQVIKALQAGRERWRRQPAMTGVRADLQRLMGAAGGVFTAQEAARDLMVLRGSAREDEAERDRAALAVLLAAVEAETGTADSRFQMVDTPRGPVLASDPAAVAYAVTLGRTADILARLDPPASPQRSLTDLGAIPRPPGLAPLSSLRLLSLAVGMSAEAALSGRQEIYRRGLPAADALRLSASAFAGPGGLDEAEIAERVRGRYPEAAPLPPRPQLDDLLREAGINRTWCAPGGGQRAGFYPPTTGFALTTGTALTGGWFAGTGDDSPEVLSARAFQDNMTHLQTNGGFRALVIDHRRALVAERALLQRQGWARLDVEALLLDAMEAVAQDMRVDWSMVLRADAAGRGRDWDNLSRLARMAWPQVEAALRAADGTTLVVNAGLIARYGFMGDLDKLRNDCGTPDGPHALALMVPMRLPGQPKLERQAVPVMPSQWMAIPESWLASAHEGGVAA